MLSGAGTWVCGEQMLAKSSGCGSTGGTGTQAPCWLCRSLARTGERGDWAWSGCSVGKQRRREDLGRPRAVHHFWNPEVNNNWEKNNW